MLILLFFLCYKSSMIINAFKIYISKLLMMLLILPIIYSCSSIKTKTERQDINDIIYSKRQQAERKVAEAGGGSLMSNLFGGNSSRKSSSNVNQLSINPHLWKASLEVLSSTMPLASVDSNSGIIITDWYNLKNKSNERVKISVLVSTQELRADGVKVSLFKQIQKGNSWSNVKVHPDIVLRLERKIVQRAGTLANNSN